MAKVGEITEQEEQRRRKGWSVGTLAKESGFSHSYVSQVESGKLAPSRRYRQAVAAALGLPPAVVFPECDEA